MSSVLDIADCNDIRNELSEELDRENFITDKSGVKCIELIGVKFFADDKSLFGKLNQEYIDKEIAWYNSQSLLIKDLSDNPPKEWIKSADSLGYINSNYGWCVFHEDNYRQFHNVVVELKMNKDSRRAVMIYNRPRMWEDYSFNGRNDFICTMHSQYFIRDNKLICFVYMRSNDAVYGYPNDLAWQQYIYDKLYEELKTKYGELKKQTIIWDCGSLHVYEKHFYLVDYFWLTDEWDLERSEILSKYDGKYKNDK